MPHNRFFLNALFEQGTEIALSGDEAHHMQHAMRKKTEDHVELVNGCHQLALAQIVSCSKKTVYLRILEIKEKPLPLSSIILCQAIPRLNRLEMIMEKGTELGMSEIWLFPGQLGEKSDLSSTQLKRLENISIAAMKQCGRLDLPKISLKPPLIYWSKLTETAFFGDTSLDAPYLKTKGNKQTNLFFIGPESGFSHEEIEQLKSIGASGVRLHPNTLRTDTAAITALSLLSESIVD